MPLRRLKWSAMLLAGSLFLLGRELEATTVYSESEADVYFKCAGNTMCVDVGLFLMGDFDGNHFEDLLSPFDVFSRPTRLDVFYGEDFPSGGSFPIFRYSTIVFDSLSPVAYKEIGDITGDGKDDIFHITLDRILVTTGRGKPSGLISPPANLTINSAPGNFFGFFHSFGDINGDGVVDFLTTRNGGGAFIVFGSTSFGISNSTINVTDPAHCMKFVGVDNVTSVASGDLDGDHYDDIVLSSTDTVYVIRGGNSLPSLWDLRVSSANWTILALEYGPPTDDSSLLRVQFVADVTDDGKADIGLSNGQPFLLTGANILAMGPVSDLSPGHANSLTPTRFPVIAGRSGGWITPKDFDGDGRLDLCAWWHLTGTENYISLILSHSFPAGPTLPDVFPPDSMQFNNVGVKFFLGDLNGDGKSDLIYQSETFPYLNVFYGHYPLENPRIVVQARERNQLRAHLTLSVDGEPTEMRISGDIADAFKDQWIPYKTNLDVTLTSTEDDKHVQAQFRNAFKRESALVQESLSLAVGTQHVTVRTNRVKEGGRATLDCSLTQAGRIKAAVFNRLGEKVLDLMDEEHGPGVWPVEWDGRNSEGNPVIPGFYILTVDISGQETKTTILVQK